MTIGFLGALPTLAAGAGTMAAGTTTAAGVAGMAGLGLGTGAATGLGTFGTGAAGPGMLGGAGAALNPFAAAAPQTSAILESIGNMGLAENLSLFEKFGKFMSDPNIVMAMGTLAQGIDPKGVGGALGGLSKQMTGAKSKANLLQRLLGDNGTSSGITGGQLMSQPSELLNLKVT